MPFPPPAVLWFVNVCKRKLRLKKKQNYVTTMCDCIVIVSIIFLMTPKIFQYIETQVSRKAPKVQWNILPNLNKKTICKILSQRGRLFAYLQECQQNLLILRGNNIWNLSVSFLDISDRNKILNFSGKNVETHISENKTQVGH